jgi:2-dehydropantoate 2-reductase
MARVAATDDPFELGPQDLVITALKAHQLAGAAPGIAALLGPHARVVMILNGIPWWYFHGDAQSGHEGERIAALDPDGALHALIRPERVIGCVAYVGCEVVAPGEIHLQGAGRLVLGEPAGGMSGDLARIGALFEGSGWTVGLSTRIRDDIWHKLLGNAAFNPVSALTRATIGEMLGSPPVAAMILRVMHEVRATGEAFGVTFPTSPEARLELSRRMGSFRTSMLQDLERGRALEIDSLVQAVVDLAKINHVPVPDLAMLLALVRLLDQGQDSGRFFKKKLGKKLL